MLREGFQGPREPVLQQNASLSKPLVAVGPHSGSLPLSCVGTAAFARSLGVRRTKESTHASLAHRRTHCKKHENRCNRTVNYHTRAHAHWERVEWGV